MRYRHSRRSERLQGPEHERDRHRDQAAKIANPARVKAASGDSRGLRERDDERGERSATDAHARGTPTRARPANSATTNTRGTASTRRSWASVPSSTAVMPPAVTAAIVVARTR